MVLRHFGRPSTALRLRSGQATQGDNKIIIWDYLIFYSKTKQRKFKILKAAEPSSLMFAVKANMMGEQFLVQDVFRYRIFLRK